jgi:mannose-6-phosphate isomerase
MAAARPVTMRTRRARPGVDQAHDPDAVDPRGGVSAVAVPTGAVRADNPADNPAQTADETADETAALAPAASNSDPSLPDEGAQNRHEPGTNGPDANEPGANESDANEGVVLEAPRLDWPWPLRMVNPVRSHGWGAKGGLAGVQRRPAGRRPEAELWVGAHPVASSTLLDLDGHEIPLLDAIEGDPAGVLGRTHRNRFGARLPFLLKVMAVERALAVQVHPARRQAAEGFARQEAAGVPLRGPARIFVDPHAKPELIVALTPFDALVGLRDPRHAADLLDLLDVAPLVPMRRALATAAAQVHGPARDGTLDALICLASWPFRQRAVLAAGVCDAARAALGNPVTAHHPDTRSALEWVIRLADLHPGDPMVLAPLLLEFVHLEPGGTVFVPPGVLHTFLHGVGLEAAAASANVVRAGLTRRPVDPQVVRAAVEVAARPIVGVGEEDVARHETALLTPAEEFRLSRITLGGTGVVAPSSRPPGPQIILCLDGEIEVGVGPRLTHLCSGESTFLGPQARDVVLSGEGVAYRVTTGG